MSWKRFSEKVTQFNGSKGFALGFTVATIIGLGVGAAGIDKEFALFTLLLSILAIYLPIFIQNSQNREQKEQARREKATLKTSNEVLRLLRKIDRQTVKKGKHI